MTKLCGRLLACAVVLTTAAFGLPAATAAEGQDAPDHLVHAGAVDPRSPGSIYMYETYFPRVLRVHRGERVRWEFPNQANGAQAFHTVTFGDPDSAPFARADEVPGTLAYHERAFFTSGCGRPRQPVCVISSASQFVNSGTPILHADGLGQIHPFDAVIDLPNGTYSYFCTLHHPDMQGTIEVVDDSVSINNPKPGDYAAQITALAQKADETFAQAAQSSPVLENGRRVWTVKMGERTDTTGGAVRVSTEAFLPADLRIRAGDRVRWVMRGTSHAVTFPDTSQGLGPPQHLTLNCEFDEPAGGAPGVPAMGIVGVDEALPACSPGGRIEMTMNDLARNQRRAPDDEILSPATFHNSGIMIAADLPDRMRGRPAGSGEVFPSQFEAAFPIPGTYSYRCMVHWSFMAGTIRVE